MLLVSYLLAVWLCGVISLWSYWSINHRFGSNVLYMNIVLLLPTIVVRSSSSFKNIFFIFFSLRHFSLKFKCQRLFISFQYHLCDCSTALIYFLSSTFDQSIAYSYAWHVLLSLLLSVCITHTCFIRLFSLTSVCFLWQVFVTALSLPRVVLFVGALERE